MSKELNKEIYIDFLENMNALVQSINSKGEIVYANKTWKRILGYNDQDIKTLHFTNILAEDQLKHCQEIFKNLLQGKSFRNIQTKFKTKKGKYIKVEGDLTTVKENGIPIRTIGIFREVK
jgi:PAS domain S-box-containing protein